MSATRSNEELPAPPGSWLADLATQFPPRVGGEPGTVMLPVVVRECVLWARRAPVAAWSLRANAQSLVADIDAARAATGPAFRVAVAERVDQVVAALHELISANALSRRERVERLAVAAESALERFGSPEVRRHAWADLVDAAEAADADIVVIEARAALLSSLLDQAGKDPDGTFNLIRWQLNPRPGLAERVRGTPGPEPTEAERLSACRDIVAEDAPAGHCVAWLSYADARLTQGNASGPVALYESDWAIPNAVRPDGQDFPHRAELQKVLDQDHAFRDRDFPTGRRYEVLARVDLGHRVTYKALNDAAAMINVMLGVVMNRSGGPSWRRGVLSCLLVDGEVGALAVGAHGQTGSDEPDHHGQNATADALAEYGPEPVRCWRLARCRHTWLRRCGWSARRGRWTHARTPCTGRRRSPSRPSLSSRRPQSSTSLPTPTCQPTNTRRRCWRRGRLLAGISTSAPRSAGA